MKIPTITSTPDGAWELIPLNMQAPDARYLLVIRNARNAVRCLQRVRGKYLEKNAYDISQKSFGYILLDANEAYRIASAGNSKVSARLRFGSQGDLVKKLQKALQSKSFYEGNLDGDFGERTLRAVMKFQSASFGANSDDGIVGPQTAAVLKLAWPDV